MGEACGMYGGQERCIDRGSDGKRHIEDLGIDGR